MNISWVLADSVIIDPTLSIDDFKSVGALWGSWRTWRAYQTDNVICHNQSKAQELLKRRFQTYCNFYIPELVYNNLERPDGVKLYAGDFVHSIDNQEEIVALHLAATTSDIVLMLGFDLAKRAPDPDKLKANRAQNYRNLMRQAFINYNETQWVVVDHPNPLDPDMFSFDNVTTDSLQTILSMKSH